jgi:FKBP-type peptidyl-prolyl cis-trans isomerase
MDSDSPVPREAYKKLDSGVIYADLRKGNANNGLVVQAGSKVNLEWVLRKSNGYFVDSSQVIGAPFVFTVGDGTAIAGVDQAVRGMNVGGARRLLIPPSLAFVDGLDDGKPGPMPQGR